MKLAVFGSTGGTGRHIVTQALDQGHAVTAFARTPEKLGLQHERLQMMPGDVMEPTQVEATVQGHDAVLCALGSPPMNKNMVRAKGTKNIISAMTNAGVRRFICQSSLGVGGSRSTLPFHYKYLIFPLLLRYVLADHELQEEHVKASPLDWVIVRPANLTNGEYTGSYAHGFAAKDKTITLKISRADVADFLLRQLVDDTYLRKTPSLSYRVIFGLRSVEIVQYGNRWHAQRRIDDCLRPGNSAWADRCVYYLKE
jgi:putative NADH-flavin reductase